MAVEVFCCYAHEDERHFKELEKHLNELIRQGLILLCHDQQIPPGANWVKAIDAHLERALIILLLISPDFLASNSCYTIKMGKALERHQANEARVIPLLVRPVHWKDTPFAHLQVLPTNAKAITTWSNQDEAFFDVVAGIRRAIEDLSLLPARAPRADLPAIWNVPYPRNPVFTGREDLLQRLADTLKTGQPMALSQPQGISGLGGIVYTQIAIEYAYRHRQDYEAILWTSADTTETLNAGYVEIARLLDLPERNGQDQRLIVKAVQTWLEKNIRWLLILDNADDLTLARDFLPPSMKGHVLLTTRAQAMGCLARRVEVDILPTEVGALFLLRRAGLLTPNAKLSQASQQEQDMACAICEELGGLPLALDQAGAYIEETSCGLSAYLSLYRTQRVELLNTRGDSVKDHPESVDRTLIASFVQVEQKNPSAADLLRLCAFLAPDVIPEAIITEGASHLGPLLASVGTKPHLLNQAIKTLLRYSLIHRETSHEAGSLLSVHRLVQVVLKDQMDEQSKKEWAERAVRAVYAVLPPVKHENWPRWERLVLDAQLCAQHIEHYRFQFREATALLHQTAWYLTELAQYEEAKKLYQRCLDIREQKLGPHHLDVASTLSGLANVYSELGQYEDAEKRYLRSLRIFKQSLGPDHLKAAPLLNNLAILRKVQGKYEEAEQLYKDSLRIWEQNRGPDHPHVAQSLNNLAVLYAEQGGKYATAAQLFKRSLDIREHVLGAEHPHVAQSLNNLANLYTEQGKYAKALQLFQRSLRIRGWSLRPENPDVARSLNNLAVAQSLNNLANLDPEQSQYVESLYQRSLYAAAESLYQRSLHIFKKHLGLKHPNVAYPLNGLAILRKLQGEYEEAERLFKDSLDIWEQNLRPEHPQVAYSLNNQAVLYAEQGKYKEPEEWFQRSLHIFKQHLGLKHIHIRTCVKNYADLLHFLNRDAEAQELEKRYLSSD